MFAGVTGALRLMNQDPVNMMGTGSTLGVKTGPGYLNVTMTPKPHEGSQGAFFPEQSDSGLNRHTQNIVWSTLNRMFGLDFSSQMKFSAYARTYLNVQRAFNGIMGQGQVQLERMKAEGIEPASAAYYAEVAQNYNFESMLGAYTRYGNDRRGLEKQKMALRVVVAEIVQMVPDARMKEVAQEFFGYLPLSNALVRSMQLIGQDDSTKKVRLSAMKYVKDINAEVDRRVSLGDTDVDHNDLGVNERSFLVARDLAKPQMDQLDASRVYVAYSFIQFSMNFLIARSESRPFTEYTGMDQASISMMQGFLASAITAHAQTIVHPPGQADARYHAVRDPEGYRWEAAYLSDVPGKKSPYVTLESQMKRVKGEKDASAAAAAAAAEVTPTLEQPPSDPAPSMTQTAPPPQYSSSSSSVSAAPDPTPTVGPSEASVAAPPPTVPVPEWRVDLEEGDEYLTTQLEYQFA
jgi:hypothetical protein